MTFGHFPLQQLISNWPDSQPSFDAVADGLGQRIKQILSDSSATHLAKGDLQPLIRQHLLREGSRTGRPVRLSVPASPPWPDASEWEEHGLDVNRMNENSFLLTAAAWHPTWLGSGDDGVFAASFTDRLARRDARCPADPFMEAATGYATYSCPGQREAVRAAFLMKPGHTLVVNLPTGSGKSLVGQAPALVFREVGPLTLFVVPTVALALDQERQMQAYFKRSVASFRPWPLAWYGGMSSTDRAEIVNRIKQGTQRILFTSPEALVTSLLRHVMTTSEAGMLRYLVLDEAHLVTQWGDDFRPAFQALAGLRNALLKHSTGPKLRTLLLSATFTQDTIETLASLFGPPDRVHMVSAVHIRPEPQYWVYKASSGTERKDYVLETVRHAPRPFILYVTKRQDAMTWQQWLRQDLGLSRIACFHGDTPDHHRKLILQRWTSNELDGIVATSAFGVGIDKSDVRTVIHATIPESLDRFYQEVGRGGRDGHPSNSLLISAPGDWRLAESLGKPTLISDELGIYRWEAMYKSRRATEEEDVFDIDIEAVAKHVPGTNDYNVSWNMRTLLLMARAGLLSLEVQLNKEPTDAAQEYSPSSPLAAMSRVRVRILNDGHKLAATWEDAVAASRAATRRNAESNFGLMRRLLEGAEVGWMLAQLYRSNSPRWPTDVVEACGGCTADRNAIDETRSYRVPLANSLAEVPRADMKAWSAYFPWLDPTFAMVFYDEGSREETNGLVKLLRWLVSACGVQEIAAGPNSRLHPLQDFRGLYKRSRGVLIHRDLLEEHSEPYSPLARVSILDTSDIRMFESIQNLQRPYHIVLLPLNTPDPGNPDRMLADIAASQGIKLNVLLSMVDA